MEKLLNLLNDYAPDYCKNYPDDIIMDEIVISKRFGFIKRLVDNDKIDFSREWEYCTKSIEEFDWLLRDDEDWLIMILAISDTPVDDLISYLK